MVYKGNGGVPAEFGFQFLASRRECAVPSGMTELVRRRSGLARIRRSCDVKHIPDNASKLKAAWSRRTTSPIDHRPPLATVNLTLIMDIKKTDPRKGRPWKCGARLD